MRRVPIRLRLTLAFAVVMAAVLTGFGLLTVSENRASLDEAISESLEFRLDDLAVAARQRDPNLGAGGPDTAEQIYGLTDGALLETTSDISGTRLLTLQQVQQVRQMPAGSIRTIYRDQIPGMLGPVRLRAMTVPDQDRVVVVAASLADRDAAVADLQRELLVGLPLTLLISTAAAWVLATAALRPVERLRRQAADIGADDPQPRLKVPPAGDELTRLAATLNDLLDRLRTARDRERQFVIDASHELRTPLSLLTTELELALIRPRSPQEMRAALRSALEETARLTDLARDLLLLARTQDATPGREDGDPPLQPVLAAAVDRFARTHPDKRFELDCDETARAAIDPGDLARIVTNLLDNACDHGASPISVTVRTRRGPQPPGRDTPITDGQISITVRDHGAGLDEEFLPRAWQRFSRADQARTSHHSGLGLAIVKNLVTSYGGHVELANHPDGGAQATVTLPRGPVLSNPPEGERPTGPTD